MSSIETHIGKLQRFVRDPDESDHDYVARFFKYKQIEPSNPEDIFDSFHDEFYKTAVWYRSHIYEVLEDKRPNGFDIFEATENKESGTIDYIVQYYNGGCCFTEAIGDALEKILE